MTRRLLMALSVLVLAGAACDSDAVDVPTSTTTPRGEAGRPDVGDDPTTGRVVLRGDGVGAASFGDAPDGVIEYLTSELGDPTEDTGWVDPFSEFGTCSGTRARAVVWKGLQAIFTDDSGGEYAPTGTDQFVGYSARAGGPRLRTDLGVGIGSRVADVRRAYTDADVFEDDVFGAQVTTDDGLWIILTGTSDDETVDAILGGQGCGE